MNLEQQLQQLQEAIAHCVWNNEACRDEFARNPRGAIKRYLGVELPGELNVQVVDQTDPETVVFVLPHHPAAVAQAQQAEAVSQDALAGVAGGRRSRGGRAPSPKPTQSFNFNPNVGLYSQLAGGFAALGGQIAGGIVGGDTGQKIALAGQGAGQMASMIGQGYNMAKQNEFANLNNPNAMFMAQG